MENRGSEREKSSAENLLHSTALAIFIQVRCCCCCCYCYRWFWVILSPHFSCFMTSSVSMHGAYEKYNWIKKQKTALYDIENREKSTSPSIEAVFFHVYFIQFRLCGFQFRPNVETSYWLASLISFISFWYQRHWVLLHDTNCEVLATTYYNIVRVVNFWRICLSFLSLISSSLPILCSFTYSTFSKWPWSSSKYLAWMLLYVYSDYLKGMIKMVNCQ